MVDFTVAIPTYNSEHRLPEVLEQLRSQVGVDDISWEVVVADNNSTDNTAAVIHAFQANWVDGCPLRYVLETQQGSAYARQRAANEAKGELIGFLDDDNIPNVHWVSAAYKFAQSHPSAGAFGSQIHADYEVEPPRNFRRLAGFMAITERGPKPLLYQPEKKLLPPSAGLVVRSQVWRDFTPKNPQMKGRVGSSQGAKIVDSEPGEDLEALLHIQNAGWEIWYCPDMEIAHKIPAWRLEPEYLINFFRGIGLSRYQTRMLSLKGHQRWISLPLYFANDLRKLIAHRLKYKGASSGDLIVACEREFLFYSFISPFYHWRKVFFKAVDQLVAANSVELNGSPCQTSTPNS